jgi:energy-coupling factor transporter ATP-binding protein EcfA2
VKAGYFSQYRVDQLDMSRSVLDEALDTPNRITEQFVRTLLGSFLFRGDDVFKKVSVLSGGEKSRLALVKLLLDPPNLLLMDEPTTHLDMSSIDALLYALDQFEGTLIFISHDVYFIRALANKVVHVNGGVLTHYAGGYQYYLDKTKSLSARAALTAGANSAAPAKVAAPKPTVDRKEQKRLEAEARQGDAIRVVPIDCGGVDELGDDALGVLRVAEAQSLPVLEDIAPISLKSEQMVSFGVAHLDVEFVPGAAWITVSPTERERQVFEAQTHESGIQNGAHAPEQVGVVEPLGERPEQVLVVFEGGAVRVFDVRNEVLALNPVPLGVNATAHVVEQGIGKMMRSRCFVRAHLEAIGVRHDGAKGRRPALDVAVDGCIQRGSVGDRRG